MRLYHQKVVAGEVAGVVGGMLHMLLLLLLLQASPVMKEELFDKICHGVPYGETSGYIFLVLRSIQCKDNIIFFVEQTWSIKPINLAIKSPRNRASDIELARTKCSHVEKLKTGICIKVVANITRILQHQLAPLADA